MVHVSFEENYFSAVFGSVILIVNSILFISLYKLLFDRTKKEVSDFYIQLLSVCINDTFAGLALLLFGTITVTGVQTAYVCAYACMFGLILQLMSQGNMLCICIQRFIQTKMIRQVNIGSNKTRVAILTTVNVLLGLLSILLCILKVKVISPKIGSTIPCAIYNVVGLKPASELVSIFYVTGFVMTILANIYCVMTIFKLRKELNTVSNQTSTFHREHQDSVALAAIKSKQRKSVMTIFMILLFFDVSILPNAVVFTIVSAGATNVYFNPKLLFLVLFSNSFCHPLITVTRNKSVRMAAKHFFKQLKTKLMYTIWS